jgi:hypothetical protein
VNEPFEPDPAGDAEAPGPIAGDAEEIDALPVLAGPPRIVQAQPLLGAALAKGRRAARDLSRRGGRRTGRAGELVQIVGSRSLLVDVHLLGGSGGDR